MNRILFGITLTFLSTVLLFVGCKKKPASFPNNYMSKMGGSRYWHGTDVGVTTEQTSDSTSTNTPYSYVLIDTFALQVDENNLLVYSKYFGSYISVGGIYPFKFSSSDATSLTFVSDNGSSLKYYYLADSIIIRGSGEGIHGSESIYIRTP